MNLNFFRSLSDDVDTCIEKSFKDLDKWKINKLEILKNQLNYIIENNLFKKYDKSAYELNEYNKNVDINPNEIPFLKDAKNILGNGLPVFHFNKFSFVDFKTLANTLFLIQLNYYLYSDEENALFEAKKISIYNDFLIYLNLYVDEVKTKKFILNTPYEEHLNKLKKIKYIDKTAEELEKKIRECLQYIAIKAESKNKFYKTVFFSASYLMACSAVKNNRNITCEDVVIGYIITFELLTQDYTSYILKTCYEKSKKDMF